MDSKKYATKKEIAEMFSIIPHSLDNMMTSIRREPDWSWIILKWGKKSVRINIQGFEDYLKWKSKKRLGTL
ncbi:hypothetical protein [Lactococcus lactis]|uniref:hypothetical protein n=1 Tax=Lactococcus lactis TaxID=1358 RepID=UPI000BF3DE16|nr:hypothetical protein [Lactococcus lactis]USI67442.1 hypothetical protein LMK04_08085 [Lactococcus petauri]MDG4989848.1 hypothetical protein [Lactococcus lactis]MDT2862666.1 hypothetical protein [Lactococcus lactis]MDT2870992.1 hypothetical protein [Lactococcus lactis]MDT2873246.1 hypothetical protein [Lactococcus lactis]